MSLAARTVRGAAVSVAAAQSETKTRVDAALSDYGANFK